QPAAERERRACNTPNKHGNYISSLEYNQDQQIPGMHVLRPQIQQLASPVLVSRVTGPSRNQRVSATSRVPCFLPLDDSVKNATTHYLYYHAPPRKTTKRNSWACD
ncbi:unnamed protein product, partial [Ectocarpus sp. 8 AP-2014]